MPKLSKGTCQSILNIAETGDKILEDTSAGLTDVAIIAAAAAPVTEGATLPVAGAASKGLNFTGAASVGMKLLKGLATGDFRQMAAAATGNAVIKGALRSRSAKLMLGEFAERANAALDKLTPKPTCD